MNIYTIGLGNQRVPGADHFTNVHELRDARGELTKQLMLLA